MVDLVRLEDASEEFINALSAHQAMEICPELHCEDGEHAHDGSVCDRCLGAGAIYVFIMN